MRVLLIEDNEIDANYVADFLRSNGFDPIYKRVSSRNSLNDALKNEKWDIVISNYDLPNLPDLDAYKEFIKHQLKIPFIIVSKKYHEALTVNALRFGIKYYLHMNHLALLAPIIEREILGMETCPKNGLNNTLFEENKKLFKEKSELMNAKLKAEESEDKFRQAFLTIPESVTFNRLDNGVYTSVNSAFSKMFEYSIEETIGKTPAELKLWEYIEERYRFWQLLKTNKEIDNQEFKFRTKSGKVIDCLVSSSIIQSENVSYVFSIFREISKRTAIQVELFKAKKNAEDANRMKSEFLANMSHEIRTPLNAIVGFSSILHDKAEGNKFFTEYLNNIIKSSKVLLDLINDILDLSKIESGKIVINRKPVNLKNLIKEVLSVFELKAKEKGISIVIYISNDLPESLIVDEKYLRQILFNLIGNAVKFTETGKIEIEITKIQRLENDSKIDFQIVIKDSGIGIPKDELNNIFEPFKQVTNQNTRKYGGTGLGLSITRRLIELLGGTINVESHVGKGSIFTITLFEIAVGAIIKEETFKTPAMNKIFRFKNPRVLIAEDNLSNREVIKLYLEPFNIIFVEAENGEECVNLAQMEQPDLILMDMDMPIMDGYTAAKLIKEDKNLDHIPIVALTASGMGEEKARFSDIADAFLLKPVYQNELIEVISKFLDHEIVSESSETEEQLESDSTLPSANFPLSIETKFELLQKFLPVINRLQQVLNFDELISFEEDLNLFALDQDIIKLKEYCTDLRDSIETFNTENIYSILNNISIFIKKEEQWKF